MTAWDDPTATPAELAAKAAAIAGAYDDMTEALEVRIRKAVMDLRGRMQANPAYTKDVGGGRGWYHLVKLHTDMDGAYFTDEDADDAAPYITWAAVFDPDARQALADQYVAVAVERHKAIQDARGRDQAHRDQATLAELAARYPDAAREIVGRL